MKSKTIIAATALACATLLGSQLGAAASPAEPSRGELTRAVVQKWSGHVDRAFPVGADAWSVEMAPAFAQATLEELQAAAAAKTFDDMNTLLLGGKLDDGTQTLGEATNDLVFVPVTPCRIIDTRLAGGVIPANTVRSFDVTAVSDYSFQGGAASNCGGTGAAGSFAAAAINFTVVTPAGAGFITAFPFLATRPLAATVNYTADAIVGNEVTVRLDQGASANELSVYSFAQTHLVADIMGYYINPVLAPLECEEKSDPSLTLAAGATVTDFSPACTAGFNVVSGGCTSSTFDGRIVSSRTFTGTNTHFCAFRNEGASPMNATTYSVCCKLPTGR